MGLDDEIFVTRCLEGDQAAFTCLVSEYKEMVYAYAYHKLGNCQHAEDITQEVFIKAYRNLAQLRWPHKFRSWLYTIASNECKLWLREHSLEREREVYLGDVPVENLNELAVRNHSDEDINLTVRSAMETLPDDRQLALTLFYMSGLSVREIAYFMGISPSNVKVKLHRARKQLGERLEKMIGKHLSKEKLRAGFLFRFVESIRDMPIPSLPKPRPIRWAPVPISVGIALLVGIIGYGVPTGIDVSSDMPILKQEAFEVSLLPDADRQTVLDTESENTGFLASADSGATTQAQPASKQHASDVQTSSPSYRLVLDSKIAGMPVGNDWHNRPDFSPGGDRVVFESQDKLYMADETGTVIRPLLDDSASGIRLRFLRWSPDGQQIAYVGDDGDDIAIFVLNPDGGAPRQVSPKGATWLRWTYDGQHLTCLRRDGFHMLALDGSEIRFIPRRDLPGRHYTISSDGEYSPNGRWLAYSGREENEGSGLWILPATGGQAQHLTALSGQGYPTWTPDGHNLYFVNGGNIWRLPMDPEKGLQKGEPQQVTSFSDADIAYLRVLRDGDQIAFQMQRVNTSINVANGSPPYEPRVVARGGQCLPQVSPDGQTIYYVGDGIFAVPRQGGTPRQLTKTRPLPNHNYLPYLHLSTDGGTLAYLAKLDEGRGIFTLPVSGGLEPQLVVNIGSGKANPVPQWSPDGSQLAYADGKSLYVIPAAGGQPQELAHLPDDTRGWDAWTVRWSPDGNFIAALGYPKPGFSTAVLVIPATGGEMRQLTPDSRDYLEGVEWHPDGQRLSYNVDRQKSETREAYMDGRPPTTLVDHPDGWDYIGAWAPDGRRFFYMSWPDADGANGYGVYIYDKDSGDITLFAEPAAVQSVPRWSRDGKTAAWYTTRETEPQVWVMENFLPNPQPVDKLTSNRGGMTSSFRPWSVIAIQPLASISSEQNVTFP